MESLVETAHPLLAGVQAIETALEEMAQSNPVFLHPVTKGELLLRLARAESRLSAVRLQAMAVGEDLAAAEGARDVAAWLTQHTRGDGAVHRRELGLAQALDRRWTRVGAALGAGELNPAQALVITRALDNLPDDVTAEVVTQAETHLVAEAAHYGPRELRLLGRRILEVVAPEVGEQAEARALEAEERHAAETTSLRMTRLGDGTTRILLRLPDAAATRLRTYLEAFTSPRHRPHAEHGNGEHGDQADQADHGDSDHRGPVGPLGQRLPMPRKLGQAFCSLLEAINPARLPIHGGDATTLIITISLDALRHDLGTADLGPTERLTAAEVRRLACTAKLIPAVLGTTPEVLDLGRSARLFSPAQRKAMIIRDRECRAHGCTIPATWCEAHHAAKPWAHGGRTDLNDGVLLCSWHHHRAHDPTYDTTRDTTGDLHFHRRP